MHNNEILIRNDNISPWESKYENLLDSRLYAKKKILDKAELPIKLK